MIFEINLRKLHSLYYIKNTKKTDFDISFIFIHNSSFMNSL